MDSVKVLLVGGAAVVVLGAGVWTITQKDAQTGDVVGEKTVKVEEVKTTATPETKLESTPKPTEVATPKPTAKPVSALTLSAAAKAEGVSLSWKAYGSTDFKYYKIVRSKTNANPRYPEDGYIQVSEDRMLTSFVDKSSAAGYTYYYRICAVAKSDGEVVCGNVVAVKSLGGKEVKDTPKPSAGAYTPVTNALKLTATKTEVGVVLSWTGYTSDALKYYKLVRSKTNADPSYPNDGYIYAGLEQSNVDKEAAAGYGYYYRACAVVNDTVFCGNVVRVEL